MEKQCVACLIEYESEENPLNVRAHVSDIMKKLPKGWFITEVRIYNVESQQDDKPDSNDRD